jgi:hypothetical protein
MFNFETKEVKEEFERMKTLGAVVIKEPYELQGMWIATLADLGGHKLDDAKKGACNALVRQGLLAQQKKGLFLRQRGIPDK